MSNVKLSFDILHTPPLPSIIKYIIYNIYYIFKITTLLGGGLCRMSNDNLTFDIEHIFTTVKTRKNFLRGDNLKIC